MTDVPPEVEAQVGIRRVLGRPGTLILHNVDGTELYTIAERVELLDNYGGLGMKAIAHPSEAGLLHTDVESYELKPGLVLGRTIEGARVTGRAYVPEDAVMTDGLPDYSIPTPVMAGLLSGENQTMRLEALCEPDDYVATVMMVTDVGMYLRYSGAWWDLPSTDVIDGLTTVEVTDGALDVYDTADQGGRQLHIDSYPQPEKPGTVEDEPVIQNTVLKDNLVAAAVEPDVELPVIASLRELLIAIPVAEEHLSIRWYIEKRRTALEPGVELPWE